MAIHGFSMENRNLAGVDFEYIENEKTMLRQVFSLTHTHTFTSYLLELIELFPRI